jgi:predicted DNA-binding protein
MTISAAMNIRMPEALRDALKALPTGASEAIRRALAKAHDDPNVAVAVLTRRIEQARRTGRVPGREPPLVQVSVRLDVKAKQQFDDLTLTIGLPATEVLRLVLEAYLHSLQRS